MALQSVSNTDTTRRTTTRHGRASAPDFQREQSLSATSKSSTGWEDPPLARAVPTAPTCLRQIFKNGRSTGSHDSQPCTKALNSPVFIVTPATTFSMRTSHMATRSGTLAGASLKEKLNTDSSLRVVASGGTNDTPRALNTARSLAMSDKLRRSWARKEALHLRRARLQITHSDTHAHTSR